MSRLFRSQVIATILAADMAEAETRLKALEMPKDGLQAKPAQTKPNREKRAERRRRERYEAKIINSEIRRLQNEDSNA